MGEVIDEAEVGDYFWEEEWVRRISTKLIFTKQFILVVR
jgi:hypothetical protein